MVSQTEAIENSEKSNLINSIPIQSLEPNGVYNQINGASFEQNFKLLIDHYRSQSKQPPSVPNPNESWH
jgi:hypothetical protein